MTRGRGRGRAGHASKISIRGRGSCNINRVNMPSVPAPTLNSQQGDIISSSEPYHVSQAQTLAPTILPLIQTSAHDSTPSIHSEPAAPVIPNQTNPICGSTSTQRNIIGEGMSSQNNTIDEGESNSNRGQQTLDFLSPSGLEPSNLCSNRIYESFKSELDTKGVNWKNVSEELKEFYFGEFEKAFCWDSSINSEVKIQWRKKAARRYSDFISVIKKGIVRPKYVPEETWESWMTIWKDPKIIEKSEINSRNRRGGENEVAQGTHTGGSITITEHRKRLAIEKCRDPTLSEMHLHVHTHGHDGKSFVAERARIVHEKYQEILQNQTQSQSDVDQFLAFYQAAGGEKKKKNIWSWISSKIILWAKFLFLFI